MRIADFLVYISKQQKRLLYASNIVIVQVLLLQVDVTFNTQRIERQCFSETIAFILLKLILRGFGEECREHIRTHGVTGL